MTVTVSPGVNALVGTKLAPRPSECGFSVPAWAWLREPVTVTAPIWLGAIPRNEIWACGGATRLPLIGNTLTADEAAVDDEAPLIRPGANRSAGSQTDRASPLSPPSANPLSSLARLRLVAPRGDDAP